MDLPLVPAVKMMVAAAPPPEAMLRAASEAGLEMTHVYGLTEVYGPASTCEVPFTLCESVAELSGVGHETFS